MIERSRVACSSRLGNSWRSSPSSIKVFSVSNMIILGRESDVANMNATKQRTITAAKMGRDHQARKGKSRGMNLWTQRGNQQQSPMMIWRRFLPVLNFSQNFMLCCHLRQVFSALPTRRKQKVLPENKCKIRFIFTNNQILWLCWHNWNVHCCINRVSVSLALICWWVFVLWRLWLLWPG